MATTVAVINPNQSSQIQDEAQQSGFDCEDRDGGTLCRVKKQTFDRVKDAPVTTGESDFFRDGVWVSTSWVGEIPDGYTQDIIAHLWPSS